MTMGELIRDYEEYGIERSISAGKLLSVVDIFRINQRYNLFCKNYNKVKKHWNFYKTAKKRRVKKKHANAIKKLLSGLEY